MAAFVRDQTVSPYIPDRVYSLGTSAGQFSDQDIGKAVKMHADGYLVLCDQSDQIYGIVSAVEAFTKNGHSIGAVACDVGAEVYASDTAGTLTRGALVIADTAIALGTLVTLGTPVIVKTTEVAPHLWEVIELYSTGAGRKVLLRKVC